MTGEYLRAVSAYSGLAFFAALFFVFALAVTDGRISLDGLLTVTLRKCLLDEFAALIKVTSLRRDRNTWYGGTRTCPRVAISRAWRVAWNR
jgi:hypothetical protein